jgi:hypothetical protein
MVKRSLFSTVLVALVVLLAPTPATAQGQDSVTGSGHAGNGTFTVNATSGPSGESPAGSVRFDLAVGTLVGSVTCLNVNGSFATVGGAAQPGTTLNASGYFLHVADNQGPGGIDLLRLELLSFVPPGPGACPIPENPIISPAGVDQGDIVVVDAQPDPAAQVRDLSAYVQSLGVDRGLTNSLVAKLNDALNALSQTPSDTAEACGSLGAFSNEVNAQAGKALTADQANTLLSKATAIRSQLSCK